MSDNDGLGYAGTLAENLTADRCRELANRYADFKWQETHLTFEFGSPSVRPGVGRTEVRYFPPSAHDAGTTWYVAGCIVCRDVGEALFITMLRSVRRLAELGRKEAREDNMSESKKKYVVIPYFQLRDRVFETPEEAHVLANSDPDRQCGPFGTVLEVTAQWTSTNYRGQTGFRRLPIGETIHLDD